MNLKGVVLKHLITVAIDGALDYKFFLTYKDNIGLKDYEGNNILYYIIYFSKLEDRFCICRYSLKRGADPKMSNKRGITPLNLVGGDVGLDILFKMHVDGPKIKLGNYIIQLINQIYLIC
jgi:hypothetical protein